MTEILFVHGALVRDGDWWWGATAELIELQTGVKSRAIKLPSCGEHASSAEAGLAEDAEALRQALDAVDGAALVVGHSYGGTVVSEGADHPAARQLLYLSSYLPEVGSTQSAIMSGERDPVRIEPRGEVRLGIAGYDQKSFAARFLQDVTDPEVRAAAWDRVTSQSVGAFVSPTTRAAWRDRPSTYVVCTQDRSTSLRLQREHAARATRSIDLPTGHHPFISRPDLVAALSIELLETMG